MGQTTKIKYREKVPWYLWRINLGTVLIAGLLAWMAWDSLRNPLGPPDPDPIVDWTVRILGFGMFGGLSAYCIWSLWENRYPLRFKVEPEEQEPGGKRFQFSLWNMMAATFWLSAGLGAFSIVRSTDHEEFFGELGMLKAFGIYALYVLMLASPFLAVGALIGKTHGGAVVGLTFVLVLMGLYMLGGFFFP